MQNNSKLCKIMQNNSKLFKKTQNCVKYLKLCKIMNKCANYAK
jgi:hypothetical protein